GESELAHEVPDAAAEGDATDTDGPGVAKADRDTVRADGLGQLDRGDPGLGPHGAMLDVKLDGLHGREVEDDASLRGAMPDQTVSAATHSELDAALASE